MQNVSRAWVPPIHRMQDGQEKVGFKKSIRRTPAWLIASTVGNGNLPRQSCIGDQKGYVRLQRFSAAQSCHFLQQVRSDTLSTHSGCLGCSQGRGDEGFDFGARKRALARGAIGEQDARFRSLAGAAVSRSPLCPHYLSSFLLRLHPITNLQAAFSGIKRL